MLVNQLQRKLKLPRCSRRAAYLAEAGAIDDVRRQAQVHDVEDVEELRAELQVYQLQSALALSKTGVFDQRKIVVVVGRSTECIAPQGTETALVRPASARNVDP